MVVLQRGFGWRTLIFSSIIHLVLSLVCFPSLALHFTLLYIHLLLFEYACNENWLITYIGHCRHHILYPLRLEPSFPNDARTQRPKANLEPNQILS